MLAKARDLARTRAPQVSTAEGYLAVMSGFANGLYDKHLSFKPTLSISRPNWVGLIIARRGGRWIVADEDPWPGRARLKGATLASCDGRDADAVAKERLGGFRAEWSIDAQRGQAAPWLLIDERNPFILPLRRCTFSTDKGEQTIELEWQPVSRDTIIARLNKAAGIGSAGYGVRRVGAGWWVSMNALTANAPAVVEAARAVQSELRAAPFVVFDVRGNGGGASDIGNQLASILYGDDFLPATTQCPTTWRVSADNRARLESYPRLIGERLSPEARQALDTDIAAMRKAVADGQAFSRPLQPCRAAKPARHPHPRVYLLTDRVCFSSCLIVASMFRDLGALHIGEATDGNTHYQENRRFTLPSGLGTIGVQATVDVSLPRKVGPFVPDIAFDGDLTDTAAVEAWVQALAR